jgi:hypothetical protein
MLEDNLIAIDAFVLEELAHKNIGVLVDFVVW